MTTAKTAMFIGRKPELAVLQEGYESPRSELCVIYGRRRIGKSTLLEKFAADKPVFFFTAGRETKRLQLSRFAHELGNACNDTLMPNTRLSEWNEALTLLDRSLNGLRTKARDAKAVVVLDEFQWMCNGSPELLSDLQRFWDKKWKNSNSLQLILCGSSVSFMLGDVLSRKSPLFGRRTRSFKLKAFRLPQVALFLPGRNRFEMAEAYMTIGGVPKYLEILQSGRSLHNTLDRECCSPSGYFFDEVRFVLSEQLKETDTYFLILQELAARPAGVSELEKATSIPSGQMMFYLERLQVLGFVSRHIPFGASRRSKKVQYRLDDYYLRFYFRFIHQNKERITRSNGKVTFRTLTEGLWDAYLGQTFQQLVRDHAASIVRKLGYGETVENVGTYWQRATKRKPGVQIDILVKPDKHTVLLCECKWSRRKTGMQAVSELREKVAIYPNPGNDTIVPILVVSGGVTKPVLLEKDIHVVTLNDFWE